MENIFRDLSYNEAKSKIKDWVTKIRVIEDELAGKLVFDDGRLNIDAIVNSSITKSDKSEMLTFLKLFVSVLNDFDNDARAIIYYSFFGNKLNEWIVQKLNISMNKLNQTKHDTVIEFAEALGVELLYHQLSK